MKILTWFFIVCILAGVMPCLAVVYIDNNATGANNGTSWSDAYTSFSNALANAAAGDEFWVADGSYTNGTASISFNNVKVYGGFTGNENLLTQRNWTNNITIIDGNSTNRCLNVIANNVIIDGLVFNKGRDQMVTVAGSDFTIRNSKLINAVVDGTSIDDNKYGVLNLSGTNNLVDNCYFGTNTAARNNGYGGAIYCATGDTMVINSSFVTNKSDRNALGYVDYGGAIYFNGYNATLAVSNCIFIQNQSLNYCGGAIYVARGMLNAVDCNFVSNYAGSGGGAISFGSGDTRNSTIRNCGFALNNGTTNGGGAIYHARVSTAYTVTVENCSFHTNYVLNGTSSGGAICMNTVSLKIKNSIFWNDAGSASTGKEIASSGSVECAYSCFTGTNSTYISTSGSLTEANNMVADPQYVGIIDLHLQSKNGRWSPATESWVIDAVDSPCIDAGDPTSDYSQEPSYNGLRINMGRYGNTIYASKSLSSECPLKISGTDGGGVSSDFYSAIYEVKVSSYIEFLNSAESGGQISINNGTVQKSDTGETYCQTVISEPRCYVAYNSGAALGERFSAVNGKTDHPMIFVSWFGSAAYCNWKSSQDSLTPVYNPADGWSAVMTNIGYRLPTEVEWYKAAAWDKNAAVFHVYGNGADSIDENQANYLNSGDSCETNSVRTTPVGSYSTTSPYNLKDASGNVWEWCHGFYDAGGANVTADAHALRGGGWGNLKEGIKTTVRNGLKPDKTADSVGFRVVHP